MVQKIDAGNEAHEFVAIEHDCHFVPFETPRERIKPVADLHGVEIARHRLVHGFAEALGAIAILLWLKQAAPDGVIAMPLNTSWMAWATLVTVAVWLMITQKMRVQVKKDRGEIMPAAAQDIVCERFPDQCPCTTELGKGIA